MLYIGCHLSVSNGYKAMAEEALKLDANTLQFFTRNPRGSKAKEIDEKDCNSFLEIADKNNFSKVVAHAPYTLNPCSPDERTREFAREVMADDLIRMEYLPNNLYDFHPGSHVKQGVNAGIEYTANMLNEILKPEQSTIVLLETMAGKGTEIGKTFQELKQILDRVELKEKIGVCFDTCHVYDAGYDIVNDLDGVLEEFDRIIGLDKLYAVHLNDSKNPFGSHKDRHEKIGEGYIGIDAIARVVNHPRLKHLPFILETPNDLSGYAYEIKMLRSLYSE
ncbi:deoxyribonuclease IV [Thermoanaerobacterium thermosaccharolyticum]|uniref:deoxyribonuclease IV n=1 Tax=Thermoanaerobacterium thermosaccharolyticum TaxID=1517 RepID=UPI0020A3DA47|nr:deoxyribonuclease IV [Thermoanaerobacterium thermosaccharolyticum]MCP2240892.1 deoxyribonuclease-4 [Thermoanaerobacterium thermosaccharolyticum]